MKEVKYLLMVTEREYTDNYLRFFKEYGVKTVLERLCYGTATDSILELMGMVKKDKIMLSAAVSSYDVENIITGLRTKTNLCLSGSGFAVFMPTGGLSESAIKYFEGNKQLKKENMTMSNIKSEISLIITIADKGNVDRIMDAARSAGATGGTVVKAGGTGTDIAKVMGISISEEKELIYIVSKKSDRNVIMDAIMEKAGVQTDAHGVVFSLPVEKVVGITGLENL